MRLIHGLTLFAVLCAFPAAANAQEPTVGTSQGAGASHAARTPALPPSMTPGAVLLEQRDSLKLTKEQIEKIEKLSAALRAKNKPLQARMVVVVQGTVSSGEGSQGRVVQLDQEPPVLGEIRKNALEAREEILELLEPEQQARARKLWEELDKRERRVEPRGR